MNGLHNTQSAPSKKVWPDCQYCGGTGLTTRNFRRGFFDYDKGVTCPECTSKHQSELAKQSSPFPLVDGSPAPRSDEVRIMAALKRIEDKLDLLLDRR